MNIVVTIKLVPDLVEELTIDDSGAALDADWLSLILNEFDDHAIEQAILLKEHNGGQVVIVAPDVEGVDDSLYAAAAKGADRLVKLIGAFDADINNHGLAQMLAAATSQLHPDLVLTGVQAHNDLDGRLGPFMAEILKMPYVGYVAGVEVNGDKATVLKEYPGGLVAEMEVALPAVLGIQASTEPPRYVAFSKIRQAMKTTSIEEMDAIDVASTGAPTVTRMFQPDSGQKATMLDGDEDEMAVTLIETLQERGVL